MVQPLKSWSEMLKQIGRLVNVLVNRLKQISDFARLVFLAIAVAFLSLAMHMRCMVLIKVILPITWRNFDYALPIETYK